jgi:hypothetical protein
MQVFIIRIFQIPVVFKKYNEQGYQRHACHKCAGEIVPLYMVLYQCDNTHQPKPGDGRHYS